MAVTNLLSANADEKALEVLTEGFPKTPEEIIASNVIETGSSKGKVSVFKALVHLPFKAGNLLVSGASFLAGNQKVQSGLKLSSEIAKTLGYKDLAIKAGILLSAASILAKPTSAYAKPFSEVFEKVLQQETSGLLDSFQLLGLATITWLGAKTGIAPKVLQLLKTIKPDWYKHVEKLLISAFGKHKTLLEAWGIQISNKTFIRQLLDKFAETKIGKAVLKVMQTFSAFLDKLKPVWQALVKFVSFLKKTFSKVFGILTKFFSTIKDTLDRLKDELFEYSPLKLLQVVNPYVFAPFLEPLYRGVAERIVSIVKLANLSYISKVRKAVNDFFKTERKKQTVVDKARSEIANFITWAVRFLHPGWKGKFWRKLLVTATWLAQTRFGQFVLIPLLKALKIPGVSAALQILEKYPLLTKILGHIIKWVRKIVEPIYKVIKEIIAYLRILYRKVFGKDPKYLADLISTIDASTRNILKAFEKATKYAEKISKSSKLIEMILGGFIAVIRNWKLTALVLFDIYAVKKALSELWSAFSTSENEKQDQEGKPSEQESLLSSLGKGLLEGLKTLWTKSKELFEKLFAEIKDKLFGLFEPAIALMATIVDWLSKGLHIIVLALKTVYDILAALIPKPIKDFFSKVFGVKQSEEKGGNLQTRKEEQTYQELQEQVSKLQESLHKEANQAHSGSKDLKQKLVNESQENRTLEQQVSKLTKQVTNAASQAHNIGSSITSETSSSTSKISQSSSEISKQEKSTTQKITFGVKKHVQPAFAIAEIVETPQDFKALIEWFLEKSVAFLSVQKQFWL